MYDSIMKASMKISHSLVGYSQEVGHNHLFLTITNENQFSIAAEVK